MITKKAPKDLMRLVPNPTSGFFSILSAPTNEKSIFLYDPMGRLVFEKNQTSEQEIRIDIRHLLKGLYLVKMICNGQCQIEKLSIR